MRPEDWGLLARGTSLAVKLILIANMVSGHARLMEPPSRASMWRVGFDNPPDFNDNQGYCGGFMHQYGRHGGKCGICGDPWDASPRQHEAGGRFANGVIVRTYRPGQDVDVEIDVTANHLGHFQFKLCANNDTANDPKQDCFDSNVLPVLPAFSDRFELHDFTTGTYRMKVRLPRDAFCKQCILQWTYTGGNNWGTCADGGGDLGCGPQEMFRACADISVAGEPIRHLDNEVSHADNSTALTDGDNPARSPRLSRFPVMTSELRPPPPPTKDEKPKPKKQTKKLKKQNKKPKKGKKPKKKKQKKTSSKDVVRRMGKAFLPILNARQTPRGPREGLERTARRRKQGGRGRKKKADLFKKVMKGKGRKRHKRPKRKNVLVGKRRRSDDDWWRRRQERPFWQRRVLPWGDEELFENSFIEAAHRFPGLIVRPGQTFLPTPLPVTTPTPPTPGPDIAKRTAVLLHGRRMKVSTMRTASLPTLYRSSFGISSPGGGKKVKRLSAVDPRRGRRRQSAGETRNHRIPTVTGGGGGKTCVAVGAHARVPGMDDWCRTNCKHIPKFCPPTHCSCKL